MCGGAQFVQQLRRDELVRAEIGPPVHDAMTYCYWRGVDVLPHRFSDSGQGVALRLENASTL